VLTTLISLSVLFLLLIGLFFSGLYFYDFAIKRNKKEFLKHDRELNDIFEGLDEHLMWLISQPIEELTHTSFDGLILKGKFIKASKESKKVAILVHGYMSKNWDMAQFARLFLLDYGFHVFMPDLRGHGDSEGDYIGFGWHDRLDVLEWIHVINQRFKGQAELLLLGISMGGATVSLLSGESLPPQVKGIVSDCAYSSTEAILKYQLKRMFHLPPFPLIPILNYMTQYKAHYSIYEGNCVKAVRKSHVPILFVHGDADEFVPTQMVYSLYEAKRDQKWLLIIPHAKHGESFSKGREVYKQALEQLIQNYFSQ
jgi:uncharacterized protein